VKKNGIQLENTIDTDSIYVLMTPFGQNCSASNSLSGGAVAGIVIASVAAVKCGYLAWFGTRDAKISRQMQRKEKRRRIQRHKLFSGRRLCRVDLPSV